jgi:hypothetical protein
VGAGRGSEAVDGVARGRRGDGDDAVRREADELLGRKKRSRGETVTDTAGDCCLEALVDALIGGWLVVTVAQIARRRHRRGRSRLSR